jgi:hypothetical protein
MSCICCAVASTGDTSQSPQRNAVMKISGPVIGQEIKSPEKAPPFGGQLHPPMLNDEPSKVNKKTPIFLMLSSRQVDLAHKSLRDGVPPTMGGTWSSLSR